MNELKKCPFCGGEVCLEIRSEYNTDFDYWAIISTKEDDGCICNNVFIESYYFDDEYEKEDAKQELIKAWNTRKPVKNVIDRLEGYKETHAKIWDLYDDETSFGKMSAFHESIEMIKEEVG